MNPKALAFALLCLLLSVHSLPGQQAWRVQLPAAAAGGGDCITTRDGGVVTYSYQPQKVAKLDSTGALLWVVEMDTPEVMLIRSVVESSDGTLLVLASTDGYNSSTVFQLDQGGNLLRQREYRLQGSALLANWICPTHTGGGYLLGGGECTLRRYAIRCDSLGDVVWVREFLGIGTAPTGVFFDVVQGEPGHYYAAYNALQQADGDWGILKFDEGAAVQWAHTLDGGPYNETVWDVCYAPQGRVGILSRTADYPPAHEKMAFTLFDTSGAFLAYNVYADAVPYQFEQAVAVRDGGFAMTGTSVGFDAYLLRTDANGAPIWQLKQDASFSNAGYGVAVAAGDMLYHSGYEYPQGSIVSRVSSLDGQGYCEGVPFEFVPATYTPPILDPTVTVGPASVAALTPAYTVQLGHPSGSVRCTSVATAPPAPAAGFRCGPSPFGEVLQLRWDAPTLAPLVVQLHDVQGRLVAATTVAAGTQAMPWALAGIASGCYVVVVAGAPATTPVRVVKH